MERIIPLKRTQFTIREVYVNESSLDKLQCKNLSLAVDSDAPSLTLIFSIRESSTLVFGNDDIEEFVENIDEFEELQLSDDYIINGLYKLLKSSPAWAKFPKYVRFISRKFDKTFRVKIESNGQSYLKILRKYSSAG